MQTSIANAAIIVFQESARQAAASSEAKLVEAIVTRNPELVAQGLEDRGVSAAFTTAAEFLQSLIANAAKDN